jgi:SAM-dependent methyltransferase
MDVTMEAATPRDVTSEYRCVSCAAALRARGDGALACSACERSYPVISGIPILTRRPNALLAAHASLLRESLAEVEGWRAAPTEEPGLAGLAERARRMLRGAEQNAALVGAHMQPVAAHLDGLGERGFDFADWISVQSGGWPAQLMLPYFYQDFVGTEDYERARALIVDALEQHRPDAGAVAVLGAGACGIVQAVAGRFDATYGIDLSVPTLLIAQRVLAGESITVHLEEAEWRAVEVRAEPSAGRIALVTANANALPFADGSLSAVVTQYLMDVVGNPFAVIAEIVRVLKPGGAWVNFSNPLRLPGQTAALGRPGIGELPELVAPHGLAIVHSEQRRFTILDFERIYTGGDRHSEAVHFFVARKVAQPAHSTADWWQRAPRRVPGRGLAIMRTRSFQAGRTDEQLEARLSSWITRSFPISEAEAGLVEALLVQIDGQRTMREIFRGLGGSLSETDFRELMDDLIHHQGVLRTGDA